MKVDMQEGRTGKPLAYLVWSTRVGQVKHQLRAICTDRKRAEQYKEVILREARMMRERKHVSIEERELDHLYAGSIIEHHGGGGDPTKGMGPPPSREEEEADDAEDRS